MSRKEFMLLMGFFTLLGLGLTAILAYHTMEWVQYVPPVAEGEKGHFEWAGPVGLITLIVGTCLFSLAGTLITVKSEIPAISAFGFLLVVVSLGVFLGPAIAGFKPESVIKVISITAMVSGLLTLVGVIIPQSLEGWRGYLLAGLLVVLAGAFGIPLLNHFIPDAFTQTDISLWNWFAVAVFSALIVYDINRAVRVPATLDNAIDCALAVYLDILNLFLRLLMIYGQRKI